MSNRGEATATASGAASREEEHGRAAHRVRGAAQFVSVVVGRDMRVCVARVCGVVWRGEEVGARDLSKKKSEKKREV